ncbi:MULTISPECIES: FliM/FliN family flagellar motor switch protein [Ralstonia]|jgi:flagellar motor switch protein FliM|uniref:Flagellar motor switch protein FliN-like C-terminal domain-containing protein n=1 Tax=Ralstonia flaminis TaxID=3058597 RepID=A0ABN9JQK7_9RALS|nr:MULTISPECIES: FliM/FliN family flagellar motor switch protein [unclassified Ralstonia]CAJ0819353.1 hypothetical protein LMG18101_03918 [Ralstonia sp. LMG 18101]
MNVQALPTSSRNVQPAAQIVLDPCTLGRPYHLLDDVLHEVQRCIDHYFHERFNLRRGTKFTATHIAIGAFRPRDAAGWHAYTSDNGAIAVRATRHLMLALLACHYDTPFDAAASADPGPESGTERRFAAQMHGALLTAFATAITGDRADAFSPTTDGSPSVGARVVRITIQEPARNLSGDLEFALDDAWLIRLFARLDAQRPHATTPVADGTPAGVRIPMQLTVRMLTKDMPLDDLLKLRSGDVLPVRLPETAEVLVGDVRLYRAALAEQQGAVCITAFEPVE